MFTTEPTPFQSATTAVPMNSEPVFGSTWTNAVTFDYNIVHQELRAIRLLLEQIVNQRRLDSMFSDLTQLMKEYATKYERS